MYVYWCKQAACGGVAPPRGRCRGREAGGTAREVDLHRVCAYAPTAASTLSSVRLSEIGCKGELGRQGATKAAIYTP